MKQNPPHRPWELPLTGWAGYGAPGHPFAKLRTPAMQAAIQRDDKEHADRELCFQVWRLEHIGTCHEALLWMRRIGRASK